MTSRQKISNALILLTVSAYLCFAGEVGKPKPLADSEKAEIYKYSARRNAIAVEINRVREAYLAKMNEEIARLRGEQEKADESLQRLLAAKTVEGFTLNDELEYVEKKPDSAAKK
jgi:hypothetical protein